MSEINIFEQAARKNLRFKTPRGSLSVEDLWNMPLSNNHGFNLDELAINLHRKIQAKAGVVSFVSKEKKTESADELRLSIVKHIIEVKLEEQKIYEAAHDRAMKKQKIMAIIAKKQDSELENAAIEDLEKMLGEL